MQCMLISFSASQLPSFTSICLKRRNFSHRKRINSKTTQGSTWDGNYVLDFYHTPSLKSKEINIQHSCSSTHQLPSTSSSNFSAIFISKDKNLKKLDICQHLRKEPQTNLNHILSMKKERKPIDYISQCKINKFIHNELRIFCIIIITYSMPPKQNTKKEAVARPDNSGIPKQDVQFKFNLVIKTDTPEIPFAIMFQWFGVTSDKIQRSDTPIIDTWQKIQGGFAFEKVFDLIRVDDDFCKTLCSKKFYIYFVNGEDNKVQDQIHLDYSSLLMFKGQQVEPNFTFQSNTVRIMGIDSFEIKITANKQLLQSVYRHYLNPFEVEVIGAKDVPNDTQSKYQPTYIRYSFFDGTFAETNPVVGQNLLIWNHKHVFLAGLIDPAVLKEKLRYGYMKFELHDRDQVQNKKIKEDTPLYDLTKAITEQMQAQKPVEEDPKKKGAKKEPQKKQVKKDVKKDTKKKDIKLGQPILPAKIQTFKNNYGVAAFYLIDFLKPSMRTARYKAPVVPRVTFQDFQSKNIDLNTTARNEMQKIISSNNYFERDTNIAVGFTLSYQVGTFVKPKPQQAVVEDPKKGKKDAKQPVQPVVAQQEQKVQKQAPKDVFERVVYIIPYKSPQLVAKIENTFYDTNIKAFSLKNKREAITFLLKPEDKTSITLDYMTGIELIDNQARIYIVQGLRQGSMKRLHQFMVKTAPNTKHFKILKNSNITFLKRLYADFNIDFKRIRFRPSLTQLLLDPIIYIKSKVPEEISQNLNRINEIKKICDDLKSVDSMNLWPQANILIQIQRKFSDSLTFEDINGTQEQKKKKGESLNKTDREVKNIQFMTSQDLKYVTMDQFTLPKIPSQTQQQKFSQSLPNVNVNTFTKKNVQTKIFTKDNSKFIQTYNMKLKRADIPANQPVYIYSSQKNNWYDKQMREMRQKINTNKGYVYTYSKDYLGLTIAPGNEEEQRKKQKELSATKNISPQKFSSLLVKAKQERMKLPKGLTQQEIDEIRNNPYHIQKAQEKQLKKNTRDLPINNENKPQFQKYIKKPEYFSIPEVVQGEKITPAERFKMQQEQKKRLEQENRKKLIGDATMKIKKPYGSNSPAQLDRYKDIRQGDAVKKGIIDVNKKTKQKRPVQNYQVSFQLKQQPIDPSYNPLIRRDNLQQNVGAHQFNNYQRPQVLTLTSLAKPLKKSQF